MKSFNKQPQQPKKPFTLRTKLKAGVQPPPKDEGIDPDHPLGISFDNE